MLAGSNIGGTSRLFACSLSCGGTRLVHGILRAPPIARRQVQWSCTATDQRRVDQLGISGAEVAERKRVEAARKKQESGGQWRARLRKLAQSLVDSGHPGAYQVVSLAAFAERIDAIPGYSESALLEVYACLHMFQCRDEGLISDGDAADGFAGDVAEIGVYDGRSFAALALLTRRTEAAVGTIVTSTHDLSQPYSSHGARPTDEQQEARSHLATCLGYERDYSLPRASLEMRDSSVLSHVDLHVIAAGAMRPSKHIRGIGGTRLFSIDGFKAAGSTRYDLCLAYASAARDLVVMLEHVFNPDWPEVHIGLALYLEKYVLSQTLGEGGCDHLAPFYIGYNKVMLCEPQNQERYLELMQAAKGCRKEAKYFGYTVAIDAQGWEATFAGHNHRSHKPAPGAKALAGLLPERPINYQEGTQVHWSSRLSLLAERLQAEQHIAASEVSSLAACMDRIDGIPGFFEPALLEVYARLHLYQRENDIEGHIVEIGVYHGRSFAPLALLTNAQEGAMGLDLFEPPEREEDFSGLGSKQATLRTLQSFFAAGGHDEVPQGVHLLQADSTLLDGPALLTAASQGVTHSTDMRVRIFSIDGCHSVAATRQDLRLAAATLAPGGVVILDDVFNPCTSHS